MVLLTVNGSTVKLDIDPDPHLLYALRNDLELNSPRFGCGQVDIANTVAITTAKRLRELPRKTSQLLN